MGSLNQEHCALVGGLSDTGEWPVFEKVSEFFWQRIVPTPVLAYMGIIPLIERGAPGGLQGQCLWALTREEGKVWVR
jgi:hypothetical protein